MKNKLTISIMAHPSRTEHFDYLKNKLGEIPFSVDDGIGLWENCKRAWLMFENYEPIGDYHLVLQDDAIIGNNFIERAERVILEAKGRPVSFYYGKRGNLAVEAKNGVKMGYVIAERPRWGLAIALPTNLIKKMIEFGDKMDIPQDDARIGNFIQKNKLGVYFPIPSLIDHRLGESLVGDPGRGRQAYKFIGE